MIKWISIGVAGAGLTIALIAALTTTAEAPEPELAATPSIDPYETSVTATGVVEGRSRNVRIAPPMQGLVREVFANVRDEVAEGDPLFRIDTRELEAELMRARARADVARQQWIRLQERPRDENVAIDEATVARLEADLADARDEYQAVREAAAEDAATEREVTRRRLDVESAEARLLEARARLNRTVDGAWRADLNVARTEHESARVEVQAIEQRIERRTVRSPIDATILKRNIEPGEFAAPGGAEPAMVIADLSQIIIRARINEEDMPRVDRMLEAVARPRSHTTVDVPLELMRVEPYAIPKTSLTGAPTELVDTRVIEALFIVQPPNEDEDESVEGNSGDGADAARPRLFPGQLVDVFIKLRSEEEGDENAAGDGEGDQGDDESG